MEQRIFLCSNRLRAKSYARAAGASISRSTHSYRNARDVPPGPHLHPRGMPSESPPRRAGRRRRAHVGARVAAWGMMSVALASALPRAARAQEATVCEASSDRVRKVTFSGNHALSDEELAGLLGELVAAGVGVAQFREVQGDLEEAFMTLATASEAKGASA